MDMETQTAQLTEFILPWVGILISLIIAVWVKDIATGLAKGLKFQMNKAFNEGDKVLLEGDDAVIIKIGISETVFGVYSDKGYIWRYVPNERIHTLKLEKIINATPCSPFQAVLLSQICFNSYQYFTSKKFV